MKLSSHPILTALALTTLLSLSGAMAQAQTPAPSAPTRDGHLVRLPRWSPTVQVASAQENRRSAVASARRLAFEPAPALAFPADVLFRSVTSGGLMGRQTTVDLMQDGRLMSDADRASSPTVRRRLNQTEIRDFKRQLRAHRFNQLQGHSFAPPPGAADFLSYQFSNAHGAVDYADGSAIPADLQAIAGLWQQLLSR
jgi:hypothetical protein